VARERRAPELRDDEPLRLAVQRERHAERRNRSLALDERIAGVGRNENEMLCGLRGRLLLGLRGRRGRELGLELGHARFADGELLAQTLDLLVALDDIALERLESLRAALKVLLQGCEAFGRGAMLRLFVSLRLQRRDLGVSFAEVRGEPLTLFVVLVKLDLE